MQAAPWPRWQRSFDDLPRLIRQYVLTDYPKLACLGPDSKIVTFGSCFAEHIAEALRAKDFNAEAHLIKEGLNSPSEMLYQVSHNPEWLSGATVCIYSAGTALDQGTMGGITWITDTLRALIAQIQGQVPQCQLILTVSPVPLAGTMKRQGHKSAVVADCVSKSTLRLALESVCQSPVRYWPSFEMFKWLAPNLGPLFGETGKSRVPNKAMIQLVMDLFIEWHSVGRPFVEHQPAPALDPDA